MFPISVDYELNRIPGPNIPCRARCEAARTPQTGRVHEPHGLPRRLFWRPKRGDAESTPHPKACQVDGQKEKTDPCRVLDPMNPRVKGRSYERNGIAYVRSDRTLRTGLLAVLVGASSYEQEATNAL